MTDGDRTGAPKLRAPRLVLAALLGLFASWAVAGPAFACSPPFEEPTIAELGPDQVVVVGTIGAKVMGGRLFHVERAFNGVTNSPIVIRFKEGEPVGDCSYLIDTGAPLIIAPWRLEDGTLYADLGTLQADPSSEAGRRYLAEAARLFGPGVALADAGPRPDLRVPATLAGVLILVLLLFAIPVTAQRRAAVKP